VVGEGVKHALWLKGVVKRNEQFFFKIGEADS